MNGNSDNNENLKGEFLFVENKRKFLLRERFNINCSITKNGEKILVKSPNMRFNPAGYIAANKIETFNVKSLSDNKYLVDISNINEKELIKYKVKYYNETKYESLFWIALIISFLLGIVFGFEYFVFIFILGLIGYCITRFILYISQQCKYYKTKRSLETCGVKIKCRINMLVYKHGFFDYFNEFQDYTGAEKIYQIICYYTNPNDQKNYFFTSNHILNPKNEINEQNIKELDVMINPGNYNEYKVILDDTPLRVAYYYTTDILRNLFGKL